MEVTSDKMGTPAPGSEPMRVYGLVLSCLGGFYYFIAWSDRLLSFGGDSAGYLLMARHYLQRDPGGVARHFTDHSQYPPLFPLLLGLAGGGSDLLAAHLLTATFFILALAVFVLWQRDLGTRGRYALLVATVFALSPGTYFEAVYIHSEGLFLVLTLVILVVYRRSEQDKGCLVWLLPVLVACLSLTRAVGVAMIVAYAACTLRELNGRRLARVALAGAPFVLWTISHSYESDYLHTFFSRLEAGDLSAAAGGMFTNVVAAATQWHLYFFRSHPHLPVFNQVEVLLSLSTGLAALCGLFVRLFRWKLDALFALFYLAIILVWPFPAEMSRFLLPVVPIALAYVVWFSSWIVARVAVRPDHQLAGLAAAAVCIIVVAPGLARNAARYLVPLPKEVARYKRSPRWYVSDPGEAFANIESDAVFYRTTRNIGDFIDENECVYSIKPSVVTYLSGRLSRRPELRNGGLTEKCHYVLLLAYSSPSFPSMYPLAVLRANGHVLNAVMVNRVGGKDSDRIVSILATWK
ncbi:MAG: hypothetical protein WB783_01785 [Arenicellales bacterium]